MANNKKMFGGKAYLLVDSGYPTKLKARQAAASERRDGYNVRVVKDAGGGYAVYRRHSQRFVSGVHRSGITSKPYSIYGR